MDNEQDTEKKQEAMEKQKEKKGMKGQVLTLKNRLVRLLSEPDTQTKQGALEYNAFLIKNLLAEEQKGEASTLTPEQRAATLSVLHVNLRNLAQNADEYIEETLERHRLQAKLEQLVGICPDAQDLLQILQETAQAVPDGLRLNQLAKLCSASENFIELDAEQALYQDFDRQKLQRGLELDLEQIMLAQVNKKQAHAAMVQKKNERREKKLAKKQHTLELQQQQAQQSALKDQSPAQAPATGPSQEPSQQGSSRQNGRLTPVLNGARNSTRPRPGLDLELLEQVEDNPRVTQEDESNAFTLTIDLAFK